MANLVQVLIPPLAQPFTYEVPAELATQVCVGCRVIVPFGKRQASGFVIGTDAPSNSESKFEIKPIKKLDGAYLHFAPQQLRFFSWVAEYYRDTLSRVLEVAIPPCVPARFERTVSYNPAAPEIPEKKLGKLRQKLVQYLKSSTGPVSYTQLTRLFKSASTALRFLAEEGLIQIESRELLDSHLAESEIAPWAKREVSLNSFQQQALAQVVQAMSEPHFAPFLLHGVTGSGKTEVYIEAVKAALAQQRGALVIVPEIALTPQLIDRFRARLGLPIAILHSALNKRMRWDSWRALLEGRCHVAIGARSAIFAPVPKLGLVIIDEEHDTSYKQSEGLRYHARDLALVRAKLESCPVVLGSATPSLESYYNAMRKKYVYQCLPSSHATAPASQIEIVDMNELKPWEMPSKSVSPRLAEALAGSLSRQEQSFVLYNRRGFASYLQCDRCKHVLDCPNCSVTLTYHHERNSLLCHYCGYSLVPPHFCAQCETVGYTEREDTPPAPAKGKKAEGVYVQRGAGTEHILDEIQRLHPAAHLDRLDRDTALDIESYRSILQRVRTGETQVLVGTQMIAKGHDLPGVTLVGIADCDVGLHLPDFRASERIFQLLTQAAGRAGRADKPGTVVLQTRVPMHPSLLATVRKDYDGFARQELRQRKELGYPPYSRMLRIIVSSSERTYPEQVLTSFRSHLEHTARTHSISLTILGPAPAPLARLKANWRWHLVLKSASVAALHKAIDVLSALKIRTGKVRVVYDLDPQEML